MADPDTWLHSLMAGLGQPQLEISLDECCSVLASQGRAALLTRLKSFGVTRLADRQAVANALGRAVREGSFALPDTPEAADSHQFSADFDPYTYAEVLVPPERALRGRPRRPASMGQLCSHHVLGTPLLPPWPSTHRCVVFAAGCFWGLEKGFWRLPGVYSTAVGYVCGHTPHPTYSEICTGLTGHTEAVQVVYDPARVAFSDLLRWFWECHDPTQGMGQGRDRGTQYRSVIVTSDDESFALAQASKHAYQSALQKSGPTINSGSTITVEVVPPSLAIPDSEATPVHFYYAEESHMQYLARPEGSPYCSAQPRLVSLPPYVSWRPDRLSHVDHAPKLPEDFWSKHAPVEYCVLRSPNEQISGFG